MKLFEFEYPWTEKREWCLPDDEEMMQGQFPILDEQIDYVLERVKDRRVCVQAGGAFGLYPLRLADYFDKVWTFEPLMANLQCMAMNLGAKPNVTVSATALWHEEALLWMDYSKAVKNSYGAHHVSRNSYGGGEQVEAEPLDLYELKDVDLIWFDVEGAELYALMGALETIKRCQPVVVIEQRYLPQMQKLDVQPNSAELFLKQHGYQNKGRTHGDSVYVPA
jgi:FkbM family methyltransferase